MKALPLLLLYATTAIAQPPTGKIIYSSTKAGDSTLQLFIMNSDGSEERQLTDFRVSSSGPTVFQSSIAFIQKPGKAPQQILLTHFGNSATTKLLVGGKDFAVCNPRWRQDGKLIAYEYYSNYSEEIWVMDSNGKNNHPLIKNARHPVWAGRQEMLFTRGYKIYSFDMRSQTATQLVDIPLGVYAKWPSISPDGQKLAYVGYGIDGPGSLYVVDLKKKDKPLILELCEEASWTDDPNYFVCSCLQKNGWQIIMVNAATGEKTAITTGGNDKYDARWVSATK